MGQGMGKILALPREKQAIKCSGTRRRAVLLCLSSLLCTSCGGTSAPDAQPVYKFENGNWYNGTSFEKVDVYVVDGILRRTPPEEADHTIDLDNGYVVPAFGEAHSHRPASVDRALDDSEFFLSSGIYYVMNHGSLSKYRDGIVEKLEDADRIDAIFANAILSSSQSHSVELWQRLINRGAFPDTTLDDLEGQAYFIIESANDLQTKWPEILASGPDFIKIMLQHSDEYQTRQRQ
jgi:hypothetical protein